VQYFAANDITFLQYKNIDISFLFSFGNRCLLTFSTLINSVKDIISLLTTQREIMSLTELIKVENVNKHLFPKLNKNEISMFFYVPVFYYFAYFCCVSK
jgi:hypothetical protein